MSLQTGKLNLSELEGTQGPASLVMVSKWHTHSYRPFRSPRQTLPIDSCTPTYQARFKLQSFYT